MGAYTSLATLGLNLALQRQMQKSQDKQLKKERDQQIQGIMARDAEARRQQDQVLRRRLAEERARAGAAGVGSSGGSADAILSGLEQESSAVQAAQEAEIQRKLDLARQTFSDRKRNNLLEFSSRWLNLGSNVLGGSTRRSLLD